MHSAPPTRRRWFQFGLGSLLWLMLVIALLAFGLNERRQRQQLQAERDEVLVPEVTDLRKRIKARNDQEYAKMEFLETRRVLARSSSGIAGADFVRDLHHDSLFPSFQQQKRLAGSPEGGNEHLWSPARRRRNPRLDGSSHATFNSSSNLACAARAHDCQRGI